MCMCADPMYMWVFPGLTPYELTTAHFAILKASAGGRLTESYTLANPSTTAANKILFLTAFFERTLAKLLFPIPYT